jgi:predicted DNA-binding transcriptional regulator YafY
MITPWRPGADTDAPPLIFVYRNHRGVVSTRRVVPAGVWYGSSAWHTTEQWFLSAYDLDKAALRDFAFSDITLVDPTLFARMTGIA